MNSEVEEDIERQGKEDEDEDCDDEEYEFEEDNQYGPYASFEKSAGENKILESLNKTTQLIIKKKSGKTITRLKQPRDLYALSKRASPHLSPRWPAEVQVLVQRPRHIQNVSNKQETSYKNTVKDSKPSPRSSDIFGKVVYDNSPNPEIKYFSTSKVSNTITTAKPYYQLQGSDDNTLLFESRFESGNLMRAIKLGEYDYELWLRFDLYTKKHTQWYYFQVKNAKPAVQYRFTIMNFIKAGSLYNEGMRPLMYSENEAKTKGIGWTRVGTKIRYYKNDIKFVDRSKERNYYSLTWSCLFPNENDTYYFAHCYPYTYSDLQEHLAALADDPIRSRCFKQRILCRTLAGNLVHVLTITAPTRRRDEAELKKAVVITARVHPGETNSSWMMKGFLDFLTSNLQDAKILRDNFIFKIVPMLNPDGVIVGNYRCSLAGRDLNRNYKTVLKDSFPSIWHTRAMIKKLQEEREVLMYCDLHGHSRRKNMFIYGCENRLTKCNRFWGRVFPMMLSKNSEDKFSFKSCRFKVQKSKEGTGRVFMWNVGIQNSFTLEASFFGSSLGNRRGSHFSISDYESMAYHFCDSILDFCDPDRSKFHAILVEIENLLKSAILERIIQTNSEATCESICLEDSLDLLSELETDSGGSDSSVSDGLPMQLLHASVPELSRRRRLKSKKERNRSRLKRSSDVNRSATPLADSDKVTVSAKSSASKNEHKISTQTSSSAKVGRIGYKKREKESIDPTPHFMKDRIQGQGKLKFSMVRWFVTTLLLAFIGVVSPLATTRREYLETLTNSFVSSGAASEFIDLKDIPHCRYTAGISSLYQNQKHCLTCERCCKSLSDGSDEDVQYVTYKNRDGSQSYSEILGQLYGNESNTNTVLDLAKRITVYNHRRNQIPSRGIKSGFLSHSKAKKVWQRHVVNQVEDYELSAKQNDHLVTAEYPESNEKYQNSTEKQKFIISREERLTGSVTQPLRLNNHFDIQKTSSRQQAKHQSSASSNEKNQPRKLPQLKKKDRNDDHLMYLYGKETSADNQADTEQPYQHSNRTKQTEIQPSHDHDRKSKTGKIQPISSSMNLQFSEEEIDILKRKMEFSGKTRTLLNYAHSEGHLKKSKQPWNRDELLEKGIEHPETNLSLNYRPTKGSHAQTRTHLSPYDKRDIRKIQNFVQKERSFVLKERSHGKAKTGSFHGLEDFDHAESIQHCNDLRSEREKIREMLRNQSLNDIGEISTKNSAYIDADKSNVKMFRSNTTNDLQSQGLFTLNLNLNISPVIYKDAKFSKNLDENVDDTDIVEGIATKDCFNDAKIKLTAENVTTCSDGFAKTTPISLRFNGKETIIKQTNYNPKSNKTNNSQISGIKNNSKDAIS